MKKTTYTTKTREGNEAAGSPPDEYCFLLSQILFLLVNLSFDGHNDIRIFFN